MQHRHFQSATAKWVPVNKSFITLSKIILRAAVERLGLDLLENPLAQTDDLLNELGPQGLELDLVQILQVLLVIRGSEQAKTVSSVK